jgi:hypothetical protein
LPLDKIVCTSKKLAMTTPIKTAAAESILVIDICKYKSVLDVCRAHRGEVAIRSIDNAQFGLQNSSANAGRLSF